MASCLPTDERGPVNRRLFDEQMTVERELDMFTIVSWGTRLYHWRLTMEGPPNTPYEGGLFLVALDIPSTYPNDPPTVRLWNRIFHPNISCNGDVYVGHINWNTTCTIPMVLNAVYNLLSQPIPYVCVNKHAAETYNYRRGNFERIARNWTKMYRWNVRDHELYGAV